MTPRRPGVVTSSLCSARSSAEEAERHLGRQRRHAGDEGGEPADDEGEEGDHPAAAALAALPPTAGHRRGPATFPAAVWHQRSEWRLIFTLKDQTAFSIQ